MSLIFLYILVKPIMHILNVNGPLKWLFLSSRGDLRDNFVFQSMFGTAPDFTEKRQEKKRHRLMTVSHKSQCMKNHDSWAILKIPDKFL